MATAAEGNGVDPLTMVRGHVGSAVRVVLRSQHTHWIGAAGDAAGPLVAMQGTLVAIDGLGNVVLRDVYEVHAGGDGGEENVSAKVAEARFLRGDAVIAVTAMPNTR
jgi:hypothetical protein